eukprot:1368719-Amorphochlora_amoeboformis.AAC.2
MKSFSVSFKADHISRQGRRSVSGSAGWSQGLVRVRGGTIGMEGGGEREISSAFEGLVDESG